MRPDELLMLFKRLLEIEDQADRSGRKADAAAAKEARQAAARAIKEAERSGIPAAVAEVESSVALGTPSDDE